MNAKRCVVVPASNAGSRRSVAYVPAQFRMEFGSNRGDDACGIVLGETTNKKHLISQREAGRDVFWEYGTSSRPRQR